MGVKEKKASTKKPTKEVKTTDSTSRVINFPNNIYYGMQDVNKAINRSLKPGSEKETTEETIVNLVADGLKFRGIKIEKD